MLNSWVLFWVPGIHVCLASRGAAVDSANSEEAARARVER